MQKIEPQKIKNLRIRQGLSQQELSRLLGISDRAISKWELGYSQPSANHLIALTQILGANIEDFLSTAEAKKDEEIQGMKSLVELFKIGRDPSSSHTMGPERACKIFMEQHPEINEFIGLKCGIEMTRARVVSIGGGSVSIESKSTVQTPDIYREYMFSDIASYCKTNSIRLWQYAVERENPALWQIHQAVLLFTFCVLQRCKRGR